MKTINRRSFCAGAFRVLLAKFCFGGMFGYRLEASFR